MTGGVEGREEAGGVVVNVARADVPRGATHKILLKFGMGQHERRRWLLSRIKPIIVTGLYGKLQVRMNLNPYCEYSAHVLIAPFAVVW
jgi:hypothetical protein